MARPKEDRSVLTTYPRQVLCERIAQAEAMLRRLRGAVGKMPEMLVLRITLEVERQLGALEATANLADALAVPREDQTAASSGTITPDGSGESSSASGETPA